MMKFEKNLKHVELPILKRDIRNFYGKVKKLLRIEDANNLKEYLKSIKEENKMF